MKIFTSALFALLAIVLLASCQKDNDDPPAASFNPEGYWRGVFVYPVGIGMLNSPGGISRLYLLRQTIDTADALTIKSVGTWKIENGHFRASFPDIDLDGGADIIAGEYDAPLGNEANAMRGLFTLDGPLNWTGTMDVRMVK